AGRLTAGRRRPRDPHGFVRRTLRLQSRPWHRAGDAARERRPARRDRASRRRCVKRAVVLFNLGGPDAPEAVRPFLRNLFSDPAIITVPNPLRWMIARLIAARRTPVAQAIYAKIGGGSPLLANTEAQAAALEARLGAGHRCFIAMRHWAPRSD